MISAVFHVAANSQLKKTQKLIFCKFAKFTVHDPLRIYTMRNSLMPFNDAAFYYNCVLDVPSELLLSCILAAVGHDEMSPSKALFSWATFPTCWLGPASESSFDFSSGM